MIYLEVIKSNDPFAQGVYEFEFDSISIGRSKKNDLIFLGATIPLSYVTLSFIEGQPIVQGDSLTDFFYLNNKKVSGTLKINVGDLLSLGENQIRILNLKYSTVSVDFAPAFENFNKTAPELRFALDFIEEVLIDLEKGTNV